MKKIVKIEPYYEPRMWGGGKRLEEEFHYHTDVKPLGEVYNVVALPNHADCFVPEMNQTLSQLYVNHPDWFDCETKELPIRVNILFKFIPMMRLRKNTMAEEENQKLG